MNSVFALEPQEAWWRKATNDKPSLEFDDFKQALEKSFQTQINWNLQPLVDFKRDGKITISDFKMFTRMFGWNLSTLKKAKEVQTSGWFHPYYNKDEAANHLLGKGVGFYLIRYRESVQQGVSQWPENESIFVLTRVDPPAAEGGSPTLVHRLLYYSASRNGFYIIKDDVFPTINDLLDKEMARGKIKYSCCSASSSDQSINPRMKMDEVEELTYKGVISFVKGYKPQGSCTAELLQNKQSLGAKMIEHIVASCEKWLKSFKSGNNNPYKLDDDELIAIGLYTFDLGFAGTTEENLYFILNNMLRKRDPTAMSAWKGYLYYLMRALDKFPDINAQVFRGTKNVSFVQTAYKQGRSIHWSAFSSTSLEERTARMFAGQEGVVFRLQLFSAKDISAYSVIKSEKELLVSPNLNFVVTRSIYKDKDGLQYVDLLQQTDKVIN
eukprot:TRINITY_DN117_c0_g2_i1.p1 TRINITY_DN117_c0_g2~~TRINITY_DN117_c0_g2_i1.p1  ORF type:complete len:439 (-),score=73.80 TRINITY_DN117_c0_g2_i1:153-1469(-)